MSNDQQTDQTPQDSTPNERLRELAEDWRKGSFANHDAGKAFEQAMNRCADDLEELLEDD